VGRLSSPRIHAQQNIISPTSPCQLFFQCLFKCFGDLLISTLRYPTVCYSASCQRELSYRLEASLRFQKGNVSLQSMSQQNNNNKKNETQIERKFVIPLTHKKNANAMQNLKVQKCFNEQEQVPSVLLSTTIYCTSTTSAASAITASPSSNTSITRRSPSHISSA
jgi:1-aminocyclopropane-1-carboxylate deaminase/D-cysteine desulfhydrase-like pyridoxal-dependent ACC family enzyme